MFVTTRRSKSTGCAKIRKMCKFLNNMSVLLKLTFCKNRLSTLIQYIHLIQTLDIINSICSVIIEIAGLPPQINSHGTSVILVKVVGGYLYSPEQIEKSFRNLNKNDVDLTLSKLGVLPSSWILKGWMTVRDNGRIYPGCTILLGIKKRIITGNLWGPIYSHAVRKCLFNLNEE